MKPPIAAIRSVLLTRGEITALVGQRVFLMQQQQNAAYPNIVVSSVSTNFDRNLTPRSSGALTFRFSVDCRSGSVIEANDIGSLAFTALDGLSGTYGGSNFDSILFVSEQNIFEDVTLVARRILDFTATLR